MVTRNFFLLIGVFLVSTNLFSQSWVQTSSTPIGGGVTDLLVRQNGDVIATVSSFNWPSVAGGIRKSTDEGQTWQNVASAYTSRTIEEAFNGYLFASTWFYPQNEGLYRSTDDGSSWQGPMYSVPSGDNIFSIAIKPGTPDYSIFLGTRNGVIRSTNSGTNFQSSNNGIPTDSWVRDLAIDSTGIIAAATTNGVFISTDNGDSWNQSTGFDPQDTVVTLSFMYYQTALDGPATALLAGTDDGRIYEGLSDVLYNLFSLVFHRPGGETAKFRVLQSIFFTYAIVFVTFYPRVLLSGGVFRSSNDRLAFVEESEGLPTDPKTSTIAGRIIETRNAISSSEEMDLYVGLYENSSDGAKIYKRTYITDVDRTENEFPENFKLGQNYPNPFNPSTTIQFSIPEESFVTLEVFNSLGENIATLISERLSAGNYKHNWNAANVPSGVYFYRLIGGSFVENKKMILLQ